MRNSDSSTFSLMPFVGWSFGFQALLAFFIGIAFYANSLSNQWAIDDDLVYTENRLVQEGLSGIPGILTSDAYQGLYEDMGAEQELSGGRYRPLSIVTFAIEHQFFGANPGVAHSGNVLLFGLSLVVMLGFLRRLLPTQPTVALLTTLLFAIHPIHTEVVANVKSRDEILSLLFMLGALSLILRRHDDEPNTSIVFAPVCAYLALLSKEYGIVLVGLVPIMLRLFRDATWRQSLYATLPLGVVTVVYLALRIKIVGMSSVENPELLNNPYLLATPAEELATKIFVLGKYLGLLIWPHPLAADYSYREIAYRSFGSWDVLASLAAYVGILVSGVVLWIRRRGIAFPIIFFLVHMLLVSNLIIEIGATMGERLLYHPSFAFVLAVAMILSPALERPGRAWRRGAWIASLLVVVALSAIQTVRRNADWKNDETLFLHDVAVVPNSVVANANAGRARLLLCDATSSAPEKKEHLEAALGHLQFAIRNHPNFVMAYFYLGSTYERLADYEAAEAAWNEVRKRFPRHPLLPTYDTVLGKRFASLGALQYQEGDHTAAKDSFAKSLRYAPAEAAVWYYHGHACYRRGELGQARYSWSEAVRLDPELEEAVLALEALDEEEAGQ